MCLGSLFDCFYMSVSSQMVVCLSFLLFCFVCLWKCLWFWNLSALTFSADIDPTEKKKPCDVECDVVTSIFTRAAPLTFACWRCSYWTARDRIRLLATTHTWSSHSGQRCAILSYFFYQEEIKMLYMCLQMPIKPNQSAVSCGLLPLFISKNKKFDLRLKR